MLSDRRRVLHELEDVSVLTPVETRGRETVILRGYLAGRSAGVLMSSFQKNFEALDLVQVGGSVRDRFGYLFIQLE